MKKQMITGLLSITFYMLIMAYSSIWLIDYLFNKYKLIETFILSFGLHKTSFLIILPLMSSFFMAGLYLFSLYRTISTPELNNQNQLKNEVKNKGKNQKGSYDWDFNEFDLSFSTENMTESLNSLVDLSLNPKILSDSTIFKFRLSFSGPLLLNFSLFKQKIKEFVIDNIKKENFFLGTNIIKQDYCLMNEYLRSPVKWKAVYDRSSFFNSVLSQNLFINPLFSEFKDANFLNPAPEFFSGLSNYFLFYEIFYSITNFADNHFNQKDETNNIFLQSFCCKKRLVLCFFKFKGTIHPLVWHHNISEGVIGKVLSDLEFNKTKTHRKFLILPRKVYSFSWDNKRDSISGLSFDNSGFPMGISANSDIAINFSKELNYSISKGLNKNFDKQFQRSIFALQLSVRLRVILKHSMILTLFFIPLVIPGLLTLPLIKDKEFSFILKLWRWRLVLLALFPQALFFMLLPLFSFFFEKRVTRKSK